MAAAAPNRLSRPVPPVRCCGCAAHVDVASYDTRFAEAEVASANARENKVMPAFELTAVLLLSSLPIAALLFLEPLHLAKLAASAGDKAGEWAETRPARLSAATWRLPRNVTPPNSCAALSPSLSSLPATGCSAAWNRRAVCDLTHMRRFGLPFNASTAYD